MSKTQKKAQDYFAQNKGVKEVYATSDGFLFIQKQSANTHAATLEKKEVQTFNSVVTAESTAKKLSDFEKETAKIEADKKKAAKKVADAKKKAEAKKQADDAEKAKLNSEGKEKNSANTGSDQKTSK